MLDARQRLYTKPLLTLVSFICLLPALISIFGVDFSIHSQQLLLDKDAELSLDQSYQQLRGAIAHALLEWSAVTLAILVMICAIIHYSFYKDITVPVIGASLLCAGFTDAFHTLAATRMIEAQADNSDFIPFTWALSRMFNGIIILLASILSIWLLSLDKSRLNNQLNHSTFLILISLGFFALAYIAVMSAANSSNLPQTTYADSLISRPFDMLPLLLFSIAGILFWTWYDAKATAFRLALVLCTLPNIATQAHMAFGSDRLFDNHFNIAHSLKILSYFIVFIGIFIDACIQQKLKASQIQAENEEKVQPIEALSTETN